jgi:hypothetical protein
VPTAAAESPASNFSGDGRAQGDLAAVVAGARAVFSDVMRNQFGMDVGLVEGRPDTYLVEPRRGRAFVVQLRAASLPTGAVTLSRVDHGHRAHLLQLSERLADDQIERALVHGIAEILATRPRLLPWRRAAAAELLSGGDQELERRDEPSGHYHARLAELRLLANRAATATDDATRQRIRAEFAALAGHLGMLAGQPGADGQNGRAPNGRLSDEAYRLLEAMAVAAEQPGSAR